MQLLNEIGLLVKPTHRCNMNCTYCYDRIHAQAVKSDMTIETVAEIARKISDIAQRVQWIWHGGEALLMGLEWFQAAQQAIKDNIGDTEVKFSLQSNGLALADQELVQFLIDNRINVGTSHDGLADCNTQRAREEEAFKSILAYQDRVGERTGCITVIGEHNIDQIDKIYNFFKDQGFTQVGFNLAFSTEPGKSVYQDVDSFNAKRLAFFDRWFYDTDGIGEREFLSVILQLLGGRHLPCSFSSCAGHWLSIDPVGDIRHCDRYFPHDKYIFGNISDYEQLVDVFFTEKYQSFRQEVAEGRLYCLENCELAEICGGGCLANSIMSNGTAARPDEDWCATYKALFKHAFERIKDLSYEDMQNINPSVRRALIDNGYRSLSVIREGLIEELSRIK